VAATLTTEQKELIRLDLGDACTSLSDALLQLAYDEANGNDCQTRVILYTWAIARLKPEKLRLVDGREVFSTTIEKTYRQRRADWEACAGTGGGSVTVGRLNYDIDATDTDVETWGE